MSEPSCPFAERIRALCAGQRDAEAALLEEHLAGCLSCEKLVDELTEASDGIVQSLASLPPSADDEPAFQRLAALLWASTPRGGGTSTSFVPLRLANPPIGPLPQTLGNYELTACIGRGAWGAVYRARHTKLDQMVAVKVLDTSRLQGTQAVERFLQEMKAAGQLSHPNIVRATDAGEDRGFHYLVMEFVDGVDVGRLLQTRGPLDVSDACEIVCQAAAALDFAHHRAWVHRDVKPSNLMVNREGVVKLLDLGIAGKHGGIAGTEGGGELAGRPNEDDLPSQSPLGTAEYMAPEQWQNFAATDARADVFSLGCTLYRLLTASVPFEGGPREAVAGNGTSIGAAKLTEWPTIPRGLAKTLERMLALQPESRTTSAAEVERELKKWARRANLPALVAEVCGGPRRPPVRSGIGLGKLTRRHILAAGATAASTALLLRWTVSEPTPRLRRNVWRDLSPVAPKLVAIEPDAQFTCDFQKPTRITVSSDELALVHLGRGVSEPFSLKVELRMVGRSPAAGVFFQGHFLEHQPQTFEFQSLDLRPGIPDAGSATCRFQWTRWHLVENDGKLSARCDPWGTAEVEFQPEATGYELLVTLGQQGFPAVVWNDRPVADSCWEFSTAGRRRVSRTPVQVQRQILGRLGLVGRGGTTEFHAPRLKYL